MSQPAAAPPSEGSVEKLFQERRPALQRDASDPDQIELSLGGVIKLDRTNEEHVKLWSRFARRLGQRVEIVTEVTVVAVPVKAKFDSEQNLGDVVARVSLACDDLRLLEDVLAEDEAAAPPAA